MVAIFHWPFLLHRYASRWRQKTLYWIIHSTDLLFSSNTTAVCCSEMHNISLAFETIFIDRANTANNVSKNFIISCMDKLTFIAQKSFSRYTWRDCGRNIWRHVCRKSCKPDRSFDSLHTGSGVEWMTSAVCRGCAKCHLLADSITGVLIMSLNERFEFQQLHINNIYRWLHLTLRMGIANLFLFLEKKFDPRIIITITLLLHVCIWQTLLSKAIYSAIRLYIFYQYVCSLGTHNPLHC